MFTKGLWKTAGIGSSLGGALNRAGTVGGKLLSKGMSTVQSVGKAVYPKAVGAASSLTKTVLPKPVRQGIGQQVSDFKKALKR